MNHPNVNSNNLLHTPLFDRHIKSGARMVPFAGWEMPVQYVGLKEEHLNVRKNVGLFDVSHMGEIRVRGPKSLMTLEWLLSNHVSKIEKGEAQYNLLMNDKGGIVDDVIVYCLEKGADYLVCVNAANCQKDWNWIQRHNKGAELVNESMNWGQIAVQGPHAMKLTESVLGDASISKIPSFQFQIYRDWSEPLYVARTGYTGESGVEIFVPWAKTADLWDALLLKGKEWGVMPIGLGARDTLRIEMKFPLYGQELEDSTNAFEAGLGWAVKLEAKDFLGRAQLVEAKARGFTKKLVGFQMLDRAIPRTGYKLFSFDTQEIGTVTSGTLSPSLDLGIGIGYVKPEQAELGTEIAVDIRGKKFRAKVVKTPFVPIKSKI